MSRFAASVLFVSLAAATLGACGESEEGKCAEYREYISQGSPSDGRDLRNGNNPCYE